MRIETIWVSVKRDFFMKTPGWGIRPESSTYAVSGDWGSLRNEFANDQSHINGIESFWAYAKLRLSKMKGIRKNMFYLHLKETGFRFNHRRDNLYKLLMKMLREQPI
ncbi:hypothetical protein CO614_08815 [Lysobacteraceae bacterium NML120232]|nr:hypothetical protein CO614_08815 [Xanthomonadaceae bacterium NML120232]